jgi:hypothetical protein
MSPGEFQPCRSGIAGVRILRGEYREGDKVTIDADAKEEFTFRRGA